MKFVTVRKKYCVDGLLQKFVAAVSIIILLGLFSNSFAQGTFTWTGVGDGTTWNLAGNWAPGVPDAGANGFPDGADNAVINLNPVLIGIIGCTNLTVAGNVTLGATPATFLGNVTGAGTLNIAGNTLTCVNLGITALTAGAGTINVSGNWSVPLNGFTKGTSNVNFNGAGPQSITTSTYSGPGSFYDVTVNKSGGTLTANANQYATNDLTITAGTFDLNNNALQVDNNTSVTGTFVLGSALKTFGGNLSLNTGATFTGGSGNIEVNGNIAVSSGSAFNTQTSTFSFVGSTAQTLTLNITPVTLNNVLINQSGGLSSVTFDNALAAACTINVIGTFTVTSPDNQGLFLSQSGLNSDPVIVYGSEAVLKYNGTGSSASQATGAEFTATVNSLEIDVSDSYTNGINITGTNKTIDENLTLKSGKLTHGTSDQLDVSGDVEGGTLTTSGFYVGGTILMTGTQSQSIIAGIGNIANMTINKSAGAVTVTSGILTILDKLTIQNGVLQLGSSSTGLNISGGTAEEFEIRSGGTFRTGGKPITNDGIYDLQSGSTWGFNGSETSPAESTPAGITFYNVTINQSNARGVDISGAVTINGTLTFSQDATINTSESDILIMGGGASISGNGTNRYVNGPLRVFVNDTGNQIFPIGTSSGYRPATFAWSSGSPNDTLQMEYLVTDPGFTEPKPAGISSISSSGHYTLERRSGTTSENYTLTLRYTDTGFNPENRNRILIQTAAGPTYTLPTGQTHNEGTDDVTATVLAATGLPTNEFKVAFGAGGTTIRWAGDSDDDWHTPANWIPASIPTSEDAVTIDSSISPVVRITGSNEAEAASLTIGEGTNSAQLVLNSSGSNPLTVDGTLTVNNGCTLTVVNNTNPFSAIIRTFSNGSTVEYQDGSIPIDAYHHLNINGADGTSGAGTLTVGGNLEKNDAQAFSTSRDITVSELYTNTAGNATYSGGLTVNGSIFNITSGTVGGTVTINSATIDIDGGSFGGTVNLRTAGDQTISGDASSVSFSNLIVNGTGDIDLNIDASVSGTLTLTDGLINTADGLLTLLSGASLSGGSEQSYIQGPLAREATSASYPIGKSNYRQVSTNLTSSGTPTVQFEVFDTAPNQSWDNPPMERISTVRHWRGQVIGATTITGGNITLNYGSDDGVQDFTEPGDLVVARSSDNNTDDYTSLGGQSSGTTPSGSVTSTAGVGSNLGYFTLGTETGDNSLPVELSSFTAKASFKEVSLKWKTFSELENEGFYLYRRQAEMDADWAQLNQAIIQGQGNTSQATEYEFIDRSAAGGNKYEYMLESISYAGVRVQEKVIEVDVPVPANYALLGNYPNPFNPTTNIRFQLPEKSEVTLKIYDMRGNLVDTPALKKSFNAGEHDINWTAQDNSGRRVASGMYIYLFQAGNFQKTGKMVLLK